MIKQTIPKHELIHLAAAGCLNELQAPEPSDQDKEAVRCYMQCSAIFYRDLDRIDCYITKAINDRVSGSGVRMFDAYTDLMGKLKAV